MAKHLFTSENNPRTGRVKGSKNRTTEEMRSFIKAVVDANLEQLEQDLDNMSATNRWMILEKLTKYFLPTLSKNDNNNINDGTVTIKVEYNDQQSITTNINAIDMDTIIPIEDQQKEIE